MGVTRAIMAFIIGKGLQAGVCVRWNGGAACRKKREGFLFEVVFISSLT
jgi:hypothetical protein